MNNFLYIFFLLSLCAIIFIVKYYRQVLLFFLPQTKGLRILMYHRIANDKTKLCVTPEMFEKHLQYLKQNYNVINFWELYKNPNEINDNSVIITFDDGYLDNYTNALPLLKKYNLPATVFLVTDLIGKTNEWDAGDLKLLAITEIFEMLKHNISFGIHSTKHFNYSKLTDEEIIKDIKLCFEKLDEYNIPYIKALAYPFGALRKDKKLLSKTCELLKNAGVDFGLLIKSKINKLPIKEPLLLKRLNIKGFDEFIDFKLKLK